ncbi:hypothetical protein PENTCL1PPCAC_3577, partial [Pristionchus entomophagus]
YHEDEAYEYINLIGHTEGNNIRDSVSFGFGSKVSSTRIEGATLVFYLRAAADPKARTAVLHVKDELDTALETVDLIVPNAPTKRYRVSLSRDQIERMIVGAADNFFSLRLSAKTEKGDELMILPGRRLHQQHMGVVLILQFPSAALIKKRRRRSHAGAPKRKGECEPGQTTCCMHVQSFSWEELGIPHIVAPAKFQSIICRGTCDDFEHSDYKHTHTRQELSKLVRKQCCHPIEFQPQPMLWYDEDDNLAQRTIHNFYANRCSCD